MEKTHSEQRKEQWKKNLKPFKPGQSGNPGGRPKGTLKEYMARKFREMSDEEKEQWLIENKLSPEVIWKMSEGNPKQDTELTGNLTISEVLDTLENDRPKASE